MAYSIKRWDNLSAYVHNGMLMPDNNAAERFIRSVVIGRKNYLFVGSHEAAARSAMLYSLVGTCKLHGINPYTWLRHVMTVIADHPINCFLTSGSLSKSRIFLLLYIDAIARWLM
ncbi:IS66 family transposase [Chitinophaga niastensis]|uniref:IS66 family transposase n=1 Tax=Chitinophaga niastensis TaxID=536980 RepID=UPI000D0D03FB